MTRTPRGCATGSRGTNQPGSLCPVSPGVALSRDLPSSGSARANAIKADGSLGITVVSDAQQQAETGGAQKANGKLGKRPASVFPCYSGGISGVTPCPRTKKHL